MISSHLVRCSGLAAGQTSVLEFGAGTGRMTRELLRIGHPVHATEPEAAMRLEAERAGVQCWPGSILDGGVNRYGGAVAHFTVVSYACHTIGQLARAAERVRARVEPGGAFVFDVINYAAAAAHLREYETQYLGRAREGVDHRIMRKRFDVCTGIIDYEIDYCVLGSNWTERHYQRAFTPAEIADNLAAAGWKNVLIFDPAERDELTCIPTQFSWALQVVAN
jgi:SAM-dependent methyltransferase